ncbi:MAG: hypothetical protein NTW16_03620 [Bacteroidetes bacterium]|nr:hypothetical protein [Bacteroidota bacterium]
MSSLILSLVISVSLFSQSSPHGDGFIVNCMDCHTTTGWKIDMKALSFNHNTTKFPLVGQHQSVNCKLCHTSLEFAKAETECVLCHTDMHNQTVGPDCGRCHTPDSWVVNNITEIHQRSRFPLVGAHLTADCFSCHTNATPSMLNFGPLGVECIDCHQANYAATTNPNHAAGGYSTNCIECHNMTTFSWSGAGINHNFFPLTLGHEITNCQECHKTPVYSSASPECISCHQSTYNSTVNPNHNSIGFSTSCKDCHTTDIGWKPAEYREHDSKSFPIYSGKHNGEWSSCSDCHKNPASYSQYTCIDCHDHNSTDMNDQHREVQGYAYNSPACFACHPRGSGEGSFNHNASPFPLTGAHITTDCIECHASGYAGTSTVCNSCHNINFNQTTNPNHVSSGIPTDCGTCHTTLPGWKPATFPIHDNYYVITGAHLAIANDCAACHQGNYANTPNLCFGCHTAKYNQSTNPNHITANFPTTCETCHSQTAWTPSTFNHNDVYPLLGAHAAIAANCFACHQGNYVNTPNTCVGCHMPNYSASTNPNHITANFPTTCQTCHSQTAWTPSTFDHNTTYPLTGAHATIANNCFACHQGSYVNTPNTCAGCHMPNFNTSTNPNHAAINIPTDCNTCHTTNPDWTPATFPIHNNYYILAGAHVSIANNCGDCHNGNYNTTPNTCVGCHQTNYNQTNSPPHAASQFPTTCLDCHTQTGWSPANWNHDSQYFPIYSGKHKNEWNACTDCHTNPANYSVFTCTTSCHPQSSMNNKHQGVSGYSYNSAACYNCHPTGSGGKIMDRIDLKE